MSELKGKSALVTGASSGFGEATARLLAKQGANLAIGARRLDRLKDLAGELESKHGTKVWTQALDVCDAKSCEQFAAGALKAFGHIDVLVNNAGLALGKDNVADALLSDWERMMDTNFTGLFRITQPILKDMLKRGAGHIVNIGSIAGIEPYEGGGAYCASKSAVWSLTQALRRELVGTDIRVTSVDPGLAETEYALVRFKGDKAKAKAVYEGLRPLTGEDVAEAVCFAVTRPLHVNVDRIVLTSLDQAGTTKFVRKERNS